MEQAIKNSIGIIVPIFRRPLYLKRCLESLKNSILVEYTTIMLINDCNDDEEVEQMFNEFSIPKVRVIKARNKTNKGIAETLKSGFKYLYENDFDIFINLDSDFIVKKDWLLKLLMLKQKCPNDILSGFNIDNSAMVDVIHEEEDCRVTNFCGGGNLFFDVGDYNLVMESLDNGEMWDYCLSEKIKDNGRYFITTKPSVCQHLGIRSTNKINHSASWVSFDFDNEVIIFE